MDMDKQYNFNISLSVLNHLGRNLYRNLTTVLGEAISNSWDADAHNVWITVNKESNSMQILDDGVGMTGEDFQNKFLKIGYSKRKNNAYSSPNGRPFIGRKGIGKLALLSCAKRIHISSKTENGTVVGGIIDNSGLDQAIKDDVNSQDYTLEALSSGDSTMLESVTSGTSLYFEDITSGIFHTVEYIQRSIALSFRFSLIDPNFNIYVNGKAVTQEMLSDFSDHTQFLWKINGLKDPYLDTLEHLKECSFLRSDLPIKGYIASVEKPSQIKIRGTQEKATIDLFVNGRLREKDILRHIPTARIVENYVYGQIHYDALDSGDCKDIFTSSREGVISDNQEFKLFLDEFEKIFKRVMDDWDRLRRRAGDDGDPDNKSISRKARKAQELFNSSVKDFNGGKAIGKKGSLVDEWIQALSEEAQFNIPSYTDCFIAENLLRKYTEHTKLPVNKEVTEEAEKWKKKEKTNKELANISYDIRQSDDSSFYLDMGYLANWIDKVDKTKEAGLSRSATIYKPVRDAVGHTSLLTDLAKRQLSLEFENIKARIVHLLQIFDAEKKN